jgi:pimeloyl-ACP methyl ester carboxylesterase
VPDATVDGAVLHYETAGEGPPLVLLHGIGSNSRSWSRQLAALAAQFKLIAWDMPGYGRSSDPPPIKPSMRFYAESLRGLLDSLVMSHVFLLGHSMGGVISQEFYRLFPGYVRALVLADTRNVRSQAGLEERLNSIRTMTPAQLAAQRAPKLLSRSAPSHLVREVESIMSEVRPAGYEFAALALAESDTRDFIRTIEIPTLLIWGAEDEITPVWEDLEELPSHVQLKIIADAGHLCYIEQPDQFNETVKRFLVSVYEGVNE